MIDSERNRLKELAKFYRSAIQLAKERGEERVGWLTRFPKDCCDHVSHLLFIFLYSHGFRGARWVTGAIGDDTHVWLQIDDTIVDITADQFPGADEVTVSASSDWHSQTQVRIAPVGHEGEGEDAYFGRLASHSVLSEWYGVISEFWPASSDLSS